MTQPPLPDLHEALLDRDGLDALLADLAAHAQLLEVTTKGGPTVRASGTEAALPALQEALLSGSLRAIQLRYRFEGAEWRDTLIATPTGVRVIRIKMSTDFRENP